MQLRPMLFYTKLIVYLIVGYDFLSVFFMPLELSRMKQQTVSKLISLLTHDIRMPVVRCKNHFKDIHDITI